MALFKKGKFPELPAPPRPDFQISKPNFEEFPSYTPTIGSFDDVKSQRKYPQPTMPKKIVMEQGEEKKTSGPIFIKMDKYEEAIDHINSIRDKVKEIERLIESLKNIKREEDEALDEWHEGLNQIKEKLLMVDKSLFEG